MAKWTLQKVALEIIVLYCLFLYLWTCKSFTGLSSQQSIL